MSGASSRTISNDFLDEVARILAKAALSADGEAGARFKDVAYAYRQISALARRHERRLLTAARAA